MQINSQRCYHPDPRSQFRTVRAKGTVGRRPFRILEQFGNYSIEICGAISHDHGIHCSVNGALSALQSQAVEA